MVKTCPIKQYIFCVFFYFFTPFFLSSQMITGYWQGKINGKNAELKIIQQGDSLTGTSYYYESENSYRRFTIRGYFDRQTNEAVWWDDQLVEVKTGKNIFGARGSIPYLAVADFNCPGSNKMLLDGKAALVEDPDRIKGPVHLEKIRAPRFDDEWDYVIDNYTSGTNDPDIIDSIKALASDRSPEPVNKEPIKPAPVFVSERKLPEKINPAGDNTLSKNERQPVIPPMELTIEEKFSQRKKEFVLEIPVMADSIELRFYDNAEIDGDSISLFLDGKLVFRHIRLKAAPFIIRLPASDLKETSELVMVAENLGEIPPNTAYMIVYSGNERFDANLASTEETSATIRLVKSKSIGTGFIPD